MNRTLFHISPSSTNAKTGPLPVTTTSADTCPDACPLKSAGACYAKSGPLAIHWAKVSRGERGGTLAALAKFVRALPAGQLWRHNQAGDLPGRADRIDGRALAKLVAANAGRRGWTYTHKPMDGKHGRANRRAVAAAVRAGFAVNLSADTLAEADELAALAIAPVAVIVPADAPTRGTTPAGRRWIVCPAQQIDGMNCQKCGFCAKTVAHRPIVAFRAHGSGAKRAERICRE